MKRAFITLLAVASVAALATSAFAQAAGPRGGGQNPPAQGGQRQGGPGGQNGMFRMGRGMAEVQKKVLGQLKLNAKQKNDVEAATKKYGEDTTKLFETLRPAGQQGGQQGGQRGQMTDAQREEMRKKMEAMRPKFEALKKAYDAQLQKIMGADTFKKYEALMKAEMEKLAKERGQGGRPGGGGAQGGNTGKGGGGA